MEAFREAWIGVQSQAEGPIAQMPYHVAMVTYAAAAQTEAERRKAANCD